MNTNGYDYIDLCLPSGTLWATCNVGAEKSTDYGLYFQWGDIQGYTKEQVGTGYKKKEFYLKDYKWYLSGNIITVKFKKYTIESPTLKLQDDAPHINMGGD